MATQSETKAPKEADVCGIIMPISSMGDKDASHWSDVKSILSRAIKDAGMTPRLVSDSSEVDIIQERIVLNLYDNPVVICDVSELNPNVMLELGMRLMFSKPTIIVTDDIASLPFDTRVIEHIPYPADLNFHKIEKFINSLSDRIVHLQKTHKEGTYKPFIESFGKFEVVNPDKKSVPIDQFILDKLETIEFSIRKIERERFAREDSPKNIARHLGRRSYIFELPGSDQVKLKELGNAIADVDGVLGYELLSVGRTGWSIMVSVDEYKSRDILDRIRAMISGG